MIEEKAVCYICVYHYTTTIFAIIYFMLMYEYLKTTKESKKKINYLAIFHVCKIRAGLFLPTHKLLREYFIIALF